MARVTISSRQAAERAMAGERMGSDPAPLRFQWHKTAVETAPGAFVPAYEMKASIDPRNPRRTVRWTLWRAPSGTAYIECNAVVIGKDRTSDLTKVQARIERIASSLGQEPVT